MEHTDRWSIGSEIDLIELAVILATRKVTILAVIIGCLLLGATYAFMAPVKYLSVAKIMPPQQAPPSVSDVAASFSGLATEKMGGASSVLSQKNPNDLYVALLTSRPIADAIIERFGFMNVYHATNMTGARRKLALATAVVGEKSGLISISFEDTDKNRAALVANAYIEELRKLTKTLAVTEAAKRRLYYEGELSQAREAVITAEGELRKIEQAKGIVQLDAQTRAVVERQSMLQTQISAKQVQLEAMRSYLTEQNPNIRTAETELSSMQAEARRLEMANSKSGYGNMSLKDFPDAGMDYVRATHELQYRRTLLDQLLKQYDIVKLDEAKEAVVVQVVEPGIAPDLKSSPKRMLILIASVVGGTVLGCGVVLLLWWKEKAVASMKSNGSLTRLRAALSDQCQS